MARLGALRAQLAPRARGRAIATAGIAFCVALASITAGAVDREQELEGIRDAIRDSRQRVTTHEADERAILERFEEVDKRLRSVSEKRGVARREVTAARRRLDEIEPRLEAAEETLARTQQALAARAVALYRGGELGPLRVIFAAQSLPDMISRANALRFLVRHDVNLVERFGRERDALDALRGEARVAVEKRESANAQLGRLARQLKSERAEKTAILARVREDRKTERRLLLELEQAAQALEEMIRALGSQAAEGRSSVLPAVGLAVRKGSLPPPVDAEITAGTGRVVDPEFKTSTFRSGVDFAAPAGTPVRCVALGVVRFAGWFRGYGRIVIVDHGDAFHTVFGHLDEIAVEVGQRVVEGETLGTVGETGSLLGPSLYFELRQKGQPVDPEDWFGG